MEATVVNNCLINRQSAIGSFRHSRVFEMNKYFKGITQETAMKNSLEEAVKAVVIPQPLTESAGDISSNQIKHILGIEVEGGPGSYETFSELFGKAIQTAAASIAKDMKRDKKEWQGDDEQEFWFKTYSGFAKKAPKVTVDLGFDY
jgi:hypothetical protein